MRNANLIRPIQILRADVLAAGLPQLRPFGRDEADDVRKALIDWVTRQRVEYSSVAAAWNGFTGASTGRAGTCTYQRSRCPDCGGRRYLIRNGTAQHCSTCLIGRWRTVSTVATAMTVPEAGNPGRAQAGRSARTNTAADQPYTLLPNVGDRITVTGVLPNDPAPLEVGATGTVTGVGSGLYGTPQVFVDWDNGRTLILLATDPFAVTAADS